MLTFSELVRRWIAPAESGRRSFYVYDVPGGVFKHGWWTYIEAVYEAEEDVEGLFGISQTYVVYCNESEYLEQIRRMPHDKRPGRRALKEELTLLRSSWG